MTSSSREKVVQLKHRVSSDSVVSGNGHRDKWFESSLLNWIWPALTNKRTLKTWIRCIVVLLATNVLVVVGPSLRSMGAAAFFCVMVAFMLPPSMALALYVLAAFTLILGMVLGWAWGIAAMAAATSVRDPLFLQQQNQAAGAMIDPNSTVPTYLQQQEILYHGHYLEASSSAIFGVFLFIGTFLTGMLQTVNPVVALVGIFATIVLDVMCSYGPLIPNNQFTLAKLFIIPALYCIACSIASLILIFPESMNHVWLTKVNDQLMKPFLKILDLHSKAIETDPSDITAWKALFAEGARERRSVVIGIQELKREITFADLEFSVGRLSATDLKQINKEFGVIVPAATALLSFSSFYFDAIRLTDPFQLPLNLSGNQTSADDLSGPTAEGSSAPDSPKFHDRFAATVQELSEMERNHGHTLQDMIPKMASCSSDLRRACYDATMTLQGWLIGCNSGRWTGFLPALRQTTKDARTSRIKDRQNHLQQTLQVLDEAARAFREEKRAEILSGYEQFFHEETGDLLDDKKFSSRALFLCFVYSESLEGYSESLAQLLRLCIELDKKQPEPRLHVPTGIRNIIMKVCTKRTPIDDDSNGFENALSFGTSVDLTKVGRGRDTESSSASSSVMESDIEALFKTKGEPRRDPDALPPTTILGKFFIKLGGILRFLRSPQGVFSLRHAIVSVALWVPAVTSTSAWFVYANRGLWALIMAQISLAVYAGEQIVAFCVRLVATGLGLLLGMAVWYIGSGNGDGNPYGVVAASVVFCAPLILARVAGPQEHMPFWMLIGVTLIFVVGYSWIDTHVLQVANAGMGATLAWKRALLVIIGFTAGFIVMLWPKVYSSRVLVRKSLASTIAESGEMICSVAEVLLAEEGLVNDGKTTTVGGRMNINVDIKEADNNQDDLGPRQRKLYRIAGRLLGLAAKLQMLSPSLTMARWEPQVSGLWPHKDYEDLFEIQHKLVYSMALLISTMTRMESKWCAIMVRRTAFMNPNFLSDLVAGITLLSAALNEGKPLPRSLSTLRDRLIYHERYLKTHGGHPDMPSINELNEGGGTSAGPSTINWKLMTDDQLPVHSTVRVCLSHIILLMDEMAVIIRKLCGTTSFEGFDDHRRALLRREEATLLKR